MQRLTGDRGAVNVVLALLAVPLIAFVAISIDVGAMHAERQQLQTAADAAALAVAQDCARGACGDYATTAQGIATANVNDGDVTAHVTDPALTPAAGIVTVETSGESEHWFAPVLGIHETALTVSATAQWGYPSAGTAQLPLIFSTCEFTAQTDGGSPGTTERVIHLTKSSDTDCTGSSGNVVPGGFGWLDVDEDKVCMVTSAVGEKVWSDPGQSPSNGCPVTDFAAVQGNTVLLPLFEDYGGTGNNAWYRPAGYAAFRITGYRFTGQYSWNAPCSGSKRCISGYFTEFVNLTDDFTFTPGAPRYGAAVVALTD